MNDTIELISTLHPAAQVTIVIVAGIVIIAFFWIMSKI